MMKKELEFLIEINKLKEIPRTGWVLRKVKNPETIAEHIFRVALMNWILGERAHLNIKRIIKRSLVHDFCEVYAGDVTPFFYFIRDLPKEEKEREKFLRKYVRLQRKVKYLRGREKFNLEKRSLLKLIKFLKPAVQKDLFSSWLDFEKRSSKEGDFARQVDKIETLLQAIEYFGTGKKSFAAGWWEECEEIVEHPLLLEFLKVIQKKFYGKAPGYKKNPELEGILNFVLLTNKLKKMPRFYWLIQEIPEPETVAGHIFILVVMAWILGLEKKNLNLEKLLKMALSHQLSRVYTKDATYYNKILLKNKKKKDLTRISRFSRREKEIIFSRDYQQEEKALRKSITNLTPPLKNEILQLWKDYRKINSPEAHFLSQLNILAILLQGLLYEKEKKVLTTQPLWEWAFETCEDKLCLELLEEMKRKFYGD